MSAPCRRRAVVSGRPRATRARVQIYITAASILGCLGAAAGGVAARRSVHPLPAIVHPSEGQFTPGKCERVPVLQQSPCCTQRIHYGRRGVVWRGGGREEMTGGLRPIRRVMPRTSAHHPHTHACARCLAYRTGGACLPTSVGMWHCSTTSTLPPVLLSIASGHNAGIDWN